MGGRKERKILAEEPIEGELAVAAIRAAMELLQVREIYRNLPVDNSSTERVEQYRDSIQSVSIMFPEIGLENIVDTLKQIGDQLDKGMNPVGTVNRVSRQVADPTYQLLRIALQLLSNQ